jgi:hypothetical protein
VHPHLIRPSRNLVLFSRLLRRYNEQAVARSLTTLLLSPVLLSCTALWLAACAAPLGPGYIVEKQEVRVSFSPEPVPSIHIVAEYHLKNAGNQELSALDVRLPGRRFHPADLAISWDGSQLAHDVSPENPRNVELRFSQSWPVGSSRTLQFSYDISSANSADGALGFSADGFFLPAESWTPELPQARGVFGFGGVPPEKWELLVRVPQGFLVHASGGKEKHSGDKTAMQFRFPQTAEDLNPFVVAGRYREARQDVGQQTVRVWSRSSSNAFDLQRAGDSLSRTLTAYDTLLGVRGKSKSTAPLWIVECPANAGCFTHRVSGYSALLRGENAEPEAEMISNDTVVVGPRISRGNAEALLAPALAESWLGYGQNPGFYQQQPPMSALPAFVAALARETSSGPQVREEIVQRALSKIPQPPTTDSNTDPAVFRAKSLLLFYALRDRVGPDAFQKALQHMLAARHGRDFDLSDLISAVEQESRQPVGPFVRQWIKRPGIPEDFRSKYSMAAASQTSLTQEATQ